MALRFWNLEFRNLYYWITWLAFFSQSEHDLDRSEIYTQREAALYSQSWFVGGVGEFNFHIFMEFPPKKHHALPISRLTAGFSCTSMKLIDYLWKAGSHIHHSCLLKETRRRLNKGGEKKITSALFQSEPAALLTSDSSWVLALRAPILEVVLFPAHMCVLSVKWSYHRCWERWREAHDFHTLQQQQGPIKPRRVCVLFKPKSAFKIHVSFTVRATDFI